MDDALDALEDAPTADVAPRAEIDKLQEVNADLNESLRLACEANKDLDAKAENLAYKLGCLLCHATGGRLSNHTYDLLTMEKVVTDYLDETYRDGKEEGYKNAKAEVAREILEELRRYIINHCYLADDDVDAIWKHIDIIEKKYTEGKE
jgi:hypothetical protein